jgi:hypothetical protein
MSKDEKKGQDDSTKSITSWTASASTELQNLLQKTFTTLQSTADVKDDKGRLFFPEGIQMIYFEASLGIPQGLSASLKLELSGDKGTKPPSSGSRPEPES